VVISKSGRDLGKVFVVVKVLNERYLNVSDGDLRKIEVPKKKNIKHLHFTPIRADDVLEYLQKGEIPANHVIKKNIKQIVDKGLISGEGGLVSG
jgi:ribosomal protein L14E/L6E/L27E